MGQDNFHSKYIVSLKEKSLPMTQQVSSYMSDLF